jgi:5,10-methylenetetrahydrofolate reductase
MVVLRFNKFNQFIGIMEITNITHARWDVTSECNQSDLQHFADKVKAGADGAITQYFYDADAYFKFVDATEKLGINIPITPGIMPITNYTQLVRFSKMCGAKPCKKNVSL